VNFGVASLAEAWIEIVKHRKCSAWAVITTWEGRTLILSFCD